ncbi:pullulanase-type alpha-1,6-glucosidase [Thalassomonas viridans]|uniref:Pullulanase-type alpha-1,6-glucosidase n=1 Tax=Thalassomonas viridans TaxID=137584 RepID=A0AAF0CAJ2_9GAMM|nr:pullulanase-type alpha-1,6-glucosidase [Thalassomonas viridans]WDE05924.1 pullulanase-type alpha-1,6-glucosidase [Thalassomonas viridans]
MKNLACNKRSPSAGIVLLPSLALISGLALAGCNSHDPSITVEASGQERVPEVNTVALGENQVAIYYRREDGVYDDWGLHLWNGEGCGDYAGATLASPHFGQWQDPYPYSGISDDYGAYYVLDYQAGSGDCLNFIIHKGDDKALGDSNASFDLSQPSRHAFTFHGQSQVLYEAGATISVSLVGAAAHWVDRETLAWTPGVNFTSVELYSSDSADIGLDETTKQISGGQGHVLSPVATFSQSVYDKFPHLADFFGWQLPSGTEVKNLLKGQLIAVAKNDAGEVVAMTQVQIPGVLDDVYTGGDHDADEQALGLGFDNGISFALWAPTAQSVKLQLFDENFQPLGGTPVAMTEDENGIWRHTGGGASEQYYYRYEVTAYHPVSNQIETMVVTDPYSLSLSTNSLYSQVVSLEEEYSQPQGWNEHSVPAIAAPEDIMIYEAHVRDFSAFEQKLSDESARGKYAAFSESDSDGINHLKSLKAAGMNHFHLLPVFDIATVNEDAAAVVDLDSSISHLCGINATAQICASDIDPAQTVAQVLASYSPETDEAQALVNELRSLDSFNWGYDPFHYTVPEGSYAQNPQGVARIKEFREMVMALHELGYRVVMDVVYNHTNASGLNERSVLDKVVPGYYHRLDPLTGDVQMSTCCDNTATEHRMMAKLMTDSLVIWARDYRIDGFRFDLMGHQPKDAMLAAREAVWAVDNDNYFYGEGWNFGEVANDALFEQAAQVNMAGTSIGTFSDRLRDAIRGGGPFEGGEQLRSNQGLGNGLGVNINELASDYQAEYELSMDQARVSLAGNLSDFVLLDAGGNTVTGGQVPYHDQATGYALDPADMINYVSKHDNQTLWDNNQYRIPYGTSTADRVRMQLLSLAYPVYAQGIPFFQMGSELLRSKSMARDSFDFGDWFNKVDFAKQGNNYHVGLPPAEKDQDNWPLISQVLANNNGLDMPSPEDISSSSQAFMDMLKVRSSSVLFRLRTAVDIMQRVDFRNVGPAQVPGLIVMSIDDGASVTDLDANYDALVVIFNHDDQSRSFHLEGSRGFSLHEVQQQGTDEQVKQASFDNGTFNIPPLSVAVFVQAQGVSQGAGLPVNTGNKDYSNIKPFGSTEVYLRGDMNAWGLAHELAFAGNGDYQVSVNLEPGTYQFKIADAGWNSVNYGIAAAQADMPLEQSRVLQAGEGNIQLTVEQAGSYQFTFNALDKAAANLRIKEVDPQAPYGETGLYLRGSMNEWSTVNAFRYLGNYEYQLALYLEAGSYQFKVADMNWSAATNFGGNGDAIIPGQSPQSALVAGGEDISLEIAETGDYLFRLNAFEQEAPVLTLAEFTPAYTDTEFYLRGTMNNWDSGQVFSYQGGGRYATSLELAGQSYAFKVADANWQQVNFGADEGVMALSLPKALSVNQGDLSLNIETAGRYDFLFDVLQAEKPLLTVSKSPSVNCVLPDSSEPGPLGETGLFVRGDLSDWQPLADYQLSYKGDNRYQVKVNAPGEINFKLADNSNDWQLQYFVGEPGQVTQDLQPGVVYPVYRGDGGTDNNSTTLGVADYSFTLTLDSPLVTEGLAGTLVIEQCQD